jgi:hypothetical protein
MSGENSDGQSGVIKTVKDVTVIVTLVSGLVSVIFLGLPNVPTSTKQRVSITGVSIENGVSLDTYLKGHYIATLVKNERITLREDRPAGDTRGAVVRFGIVSEGVRKKRLPIRWSLIDRHTHTIAAESEAVDPVAQPIASSAARKDLDIGTWEIWVNTSPFKGKRLFLRIEIYDDNNYDRLTFKETKSFVAKSE